MEDNTLEEPVHVTVQMASLDLAVEVSALCVGQVFCVNCLKVDTHSYAYERLKCTHNLFIDDNTISVCPNSAKYIISIAFALIVTACARICQNGGTLNAGTCTCDCTNGYIGATCGSKCTAACMGCRSCCIVVCQVPFKSVAAAVV